MKIKPRHPSSAKWQRNCHGQSPNCKTIFLATTQRWAVRTSHLISTSCQSTQAQGSSSIAKARSAGLPSLWQSEKTPHRFPRLLRWKPPTISPLHAPKTLLPRTALPFSAGSRSTRTVTFSRPPLPLQGAGRAPLKKLPSIQTCTF